MGTAKWSYSIILKNFGCVIPLDLLQHYSNKKFTNNSRDTTWNIFILGYKNKKKLWVYPKHTYNGSINGSLKTKLIAESSEEYYNWCDSQYWHLQPQLQNYKKSEKLQRLRIETRIICEYKYMNFMLDYQKPFICLIKKKFH